MSCNICWQVVCPHLSPKEAHAYLDSYYCEHCCGDAQ